MKKDMTLFLVKLGGSLITDKSKPYVHKPSVMKRLAKEIKKARSKRDDLLLVIGHGGGSYPHVPATKYQTHKGFIHKDSLIGLCEVQDSAARLNRIVVRAFLDEGLPAMSLHPSSMMFGDKGEVSGAYLPTLQLLLSHHAIPVFYGDSVLDIGQGCSIFSTEVILSFLATRLAKRYLLERIILCGKTDGVFDEHGTIIKTISTRNIAQVKKAIGKAEGYDVTGGMIHKVEESLKLAKLGIPSFVMNGTRKDALYHALLGTSVTGTLISE